MPKRLAEYRWRDWSRLRPLLHALKTCRYRVRDERYLATEPVDSCLESLRDRIRDQRLLVVIAFNDSETIRWQSRLIQRNVRDVIYVVVDNSSDPVAASEIANYCREQEISHVRLESNPWTGRNPSRSHGLAMNWAWRHLVLPGRPGYFGFIDHDLFPIVPTEPFQPLMSEGLVCHGDLRQVGERWFLWAGFCLFDYRRVCHLPLDFGLDWFAGLDTGGANYEVLYRHIDRMSISQRVIRQFPVWRDRPLRDAYFEWRGDWLHEVGLDVRPELRTAKRKVLLELLSAMNPLLHHQLRAVA